MLPRDPRLHIRSPRGQPPIHGGMPTLTTSDVDLTRTDSETNARRNRRLPDAPHRDLDIELWSRFNDRWGWRGTGHERCNKRSARQTLKTRYCGVLYHD